MMSSYVSAMEAALLPCLPARELQAIDRTAHASHQNNQKRVEFPCHVMKLLHDLFIRFTLQICNNFYIDFMEAAKKLQLYFIGLQHGDQPTKEEMLRQEIEAMEEELKTKTEMIKKHEILVQDWRKELKVQLNKHVSELERV